MKKYFFGFLLLILISGCSVKQTQKMDNLKETTAANINKRDYFNDLALHDAIRAKYFDIAKILIHRGAKLELKDRYGYTPLHLAAIFDEEETAKLLIEKGASVNNIDRYGDTPLIDSTRNNFTNMTRILVCNGIDRNVSDKNRITPLHYATKNKNLYLSELLMATNLEPYCKELFTISLPETIQSTETKPKICGKAEEGEVSTAKVSLKNSLEEDMGTFAAVVDETGKNWCADVTTELALGEYNIKADAVSKSLVNATANAKLEILEAMPVVEPEPAPVIEEETLLNETNSAITLSLHDALYNEFKDDFKVWNAVLNDDLTIRFKDPSLMFKRGNSALTDPYKEVLSNFLPRYINILKEYKDQIASVEIQGHTSSTYRSAKTEEEKFKKNEILSAKRAQNVLDFMLSSENENITSNLEWINQDFKTVGKSSSELIKNFDGTENRELSKRVEFKIILAMP